MAQAVIASLSPPIARSDMRQWLNQHGERPVLWLALGAAAGLPAVWLFFVLERARRERGHA